MTINTLQRAGSALLLTAALAVSGAPAVRANSAQMWWEGVSGSGAIVTGEECPITVEHETLTFELPEFPLPHYASAEEYLAYTGRVTAEYTFHNPADYAVTAKLVFPFGGTPMYGSVYDSESGEYLSNLDTEKYDITVNGQPIEKRLRHTLSGRERDFVFEEELAKLRDGYAQDAFYSPDLPVTKYVYTAQGIGNKYEAATASFLLKADGSKTKVLFENQSGCQIQDGGLLLTAWAQNGGTYTVYVIGEPLDGEPVWTFYENGRCDTEIDGTLTLTGTEQMTFKELALTGWSESGGVSETDWYNARMEAFYRDEQANGAISFSDGGTPFIESLMRWYEYSITLEPGQTITNTVTAPMYPTIDGWYEPAVHSYVYYLSPAQSWVQFGSLDIFVNTPYYMTGSDMSFTRTDEGYTLSRDGLPPGDLRFSLCAQEKPERRRGSYGIGLPLEFIPFLIISGIVLIGGGITAVVLICRIRNKKTQGG